MAELSASRELSKFPTDALMNFETRDAQTRVKHFILESYAGAWSGIISRGLRGRQGRFVADLAYIDGYGGAGRFQRDSDGSVATQPIWGSPIIGISTLRETIAKAPAGDVEIRLTAFVVEKDPGLYSSLVKSLNDANLGLTVREKTRFGPEDLGTVAVLKGDFRSHVRSILSAVGPRAFVLAFVDPYGPSMPLPLLRQLIARQKTDVITLFPVADIDRRAGSVLKPSEALESGDFGNITRITGHFGSEEWKEIARSSEKDVAVRGERYADLYDRQLRRVDPAVVVKNIPLRFSGIDRIVHHFFLTTRDADGAFGMERILRKPEISQHYSLWADAVQRQREKDAASAQGSFFDTLGALPATAPAVEARKVEVEEVVAIILAKCPRNQVMPVKEFVKYVADEPLIETEVHRALRKLRSDGIAEFDALSGKAPIRLK